jgi:ribosome maturation factor RimP
LEVREELRQLAQPLADEEGFELVDVEIMVQGGRRVVRILLDRPGGIRVGDCASFSRRMSDCLDMNQTIPGHYFLEVSSPGLDRPLRSIENLQRFAGQRASLTTVHPYEGRRRFEGLLLGPQEERAGIRTDDGQEYWFDWSDVKTAHLVVDPWPQRRREGGAR